MTSGIYHVTFSGSPSHNSGEGLAVIKDGKVNGGDLGYLYRGSFRETGSSVSARLNISQWKPGYTSVFGNFTNFDLELEGSMADGGSSFSVQGRVVQHQSFQITIRGRRIGDTE